MSYTRLRTRNREALADTLEALAGHIRADHARDVQRLLTESATADGYPGLASGAGGDSPGRSNQVDDDGHHVAPDTPTESAALHRDRDANRALQQIAALDILAHVAGPCLDALASWDPTRTVAICRLCGEPLDRGAGRCLRTDPDTGRQCGAAGDRALHCANPNCGDELTPGKIRRGRCPACAEHHRTTGTERIPAAALALGDDVIVTDDGTAHVG